MDGVHPSPREADREAMADALRASVAEGHGYTGMNALEAGIGEAVNAFLPLSARSDLTRTQAVAASRAAVLDALVYIARQHGWRP